MIDHLSLSAEKDYILASDAMAAVGLRDLLETPHREAEIDIMALPDTVNGAAQFPSVACDRLIVCLPYDPALLLLILKKTAACLAQPNAPEETYLITPFSLNWLYHTLRPLIAPDQLRKVCAIDSALSQTEITERLSTPFTSENCLAIQARREEIATGNSLVGLTRREYDCVLDFFCGRSVQDPLYSYKKSASSTRYSQRNTGLRKLTEQLPTAAAFIRKKRSELQ